MMELIFNELSILPFAEDFSDCYKRMMQFVATYKTAELHGFKRVRFQQAFDQIMLQSNYSLSDFISDSRTRTLANILLGIYRYPFIDDDSEEENRYIQNKFFIMKNGNRRSVHGLAAVYLYQTIGISFCSEPFWDDILFSLQIEGEENCTENVLSVSCHEHFFEQVFLEWKEINAEICLIECDICYANKKISLRDDHGKDILFRFAKKLIRSPYVIEIVNSLPYNQSENKFIKKVKYDGLIEIILSNTDRGLGLVLKSTGRNYNETKEIAKILQQEFEEKY